MEGQRDREIEEGRGEGRKNGKRNQLPLIKFPVQVGQAPHLCAVASAWNCFKAGSGVVFLSFHHLQLLCQLHLLLGPSNFIHNSFLIQHIWYLSLSNRLYLHKGRNLPCVSQCLVVLWKQCVLSGCTTFEKLCLSVLFPIHPVPFVRGNRYPFLACPSRENLCILKVLHVWFPDSILPNILHFAFLHLKIYLLHFCCTSNVRSCLILSLTSSSAFHSSVWHVILFKSINSSLTFKIILLFFILLLHIVL